MSKIFKVILGLSLLVSAQTESAAGRFARGAWKFVKAPSTVLGATGTVIMHNHLKTEQEVSFNSLKEQSSLQDNIESRDNLLLELDKLLPEDFSSFEVKSRKKEVKDILRKNHPKAKPEFVFFSGKQEFPLACANFNDKFGIVIGKTQLESKKLLEHAVGHELVHAEYGDVNNKITIRSALPGTIGTAYTIPRLAGRGRIFSLTASVIALLGYPFAEAKHDQFSEYRADRKASSDPIACDAAAAYCELEALTEEAFIQKERNLTPKEKKSTLEMNLYMLKLLHSHPPYTKRAEALRAQAAKLRAEQEKK